MSGRTKVLVLGAGGMLGNAVLRLCAASPGFEAIGTTRSSAAHKFPASVAGLLRSNVDVESPDALTTVLAEVRPDVVINCVGVVKQLAASDDPLVALPINALLPHRLARLSALVGARVVHVSTDCVFSGRQGNYSESDLPDAVDLYGRSKFLGEVDYPNAITLRTSIIGHELGTRHGLIEWFLAQEAAVKGFTRAVFSGLPTVELARVIRDHVIPRPKMRGLYHVSAAPISKYELLRMVATVYGKQIDIAPSDDTVIDRSLDSSRFRAETGYEPAPWEDLVIAMREFR